VTAAEPHYHAFDGTLVRYFIGTDEVSRDPSPRAPLRSQARWTAVVSLDVLRAPGIVVTPLARADLPVGVSEGFLATFPDNDTYRVGFDERTLLVWAQGPLDLSPVARGEATARFGEHRRSGGLWLPFVASYAFGATRLADERVLAACVAPPGLTPTAFTDPIQLPACDASSHADCAEASSDPHTSPRMASTTPSHRASKP
jgi:hypothetical protein